MGDAGLLHLPYATPFIFLCSVLALGYPLWSDIVRVTELENSARTATNAATQADGLLHKERAFLRQVIDLNPNLIFAKDRQGRFTLVNQAVADIYGTTVDALIGKTDADFNRNLEEVEMFRRADLEVMDTLQERFIPEESITDAAGIVRWMQTVKRPVLSQDGTANQVLGTATDITRRKQADLELEQQRSELAHLSRVTMLGELSGSLAHELNQPLSAILSNAQAAHGSWRAPLNLDEVRGILKTSWKTTSTRLLIRRLRLLLKKARSISSLSTSAGLCRTPRCAAISSIAAWRWIEIAPNAVVVAAVIQQIW
jgi:PAS domain S-box-containing protein